MSVHRDSDGRFEDNPVVDWLSDNRSIVVPVVSVLAGLLGWQLYAMGQPSYLFPQLQHVYEAFVVQLTDDGLVNAFLWSVTTLFVGFAIAAVVGVALGLAMGVNDVLDVVLNPYVNAFYVAPVSALIPIIIFVGGATFESRVFIVFLFGVFEIIITTYKGVTTTPEGTREAARSFGAGTAFELRHVVLPSSVPYIFTGLRLGMGRAVRGLILAELLISFVNLGAILRVWADSFRVAGVFSIVILLMALGIVLTKAFNVLESRLIDWKAEVDV